MKQVFQNLKNGEVSIPDIPTPKVKRGHLLIRTSKSLISLGTEKMLLEFGKGSFISKARQQPDKVKMVLQKIKTDGLAPTINSVKNKLDTPLPMGYSNVGIVLEVGVGVHGYKVGDRVLSNGPHAEVVCVPENLCCKIPENVSNEAASFTVVSAIGLQGIRLVNPTIGETVVVVGLGLIGLLSVQILKANGCHVIAYDFDERKVELAKKYGASAFVINEGVDPVKNVLSLTSEVGADAVLITASAKTDQIISDSASMCRKRGRVVLVGVIGLNISRSDFYEKEISFQVSCSYGPGRYESEYEKKGLDYPIGFVRWTEQRNFSAILALMSDQKIITDELIDKSVPLEEAPSLYSSIGGGSELGLMIDYKTTNDLLRTVVLNPGFKSQVSRANIGFIGAGSFSGHTLIPAFKEASVNLKSIASSSGSTGYHQGKKWGFSETTSDYTQYWDSEIDTVVITTPHNSHCKIVFEALRASKNVFVEKPLALNLDELLELEDYIKTLDSAPALMIGFNRRFSPLVIKSKELLKDLEQPKSIIMTVNAGEIPMTHWTQDLDVGGGRLVGEGCHFIDLVRHVADSAITSSSVEFADTVAKDVFTISLKFENGSIGTVHYFANGNKDVSKEKLEVYCGGKILILDNFKKLSGYGFSNFNKIKLNNQDKGHKEEVLQFVNYIQGKSENAPIPMNELFEVSKIAIELFNKA